MTQVLNEFSTLRRPRLLIRAARFGAAGYTRKAYLPRILGYGTAPHGAATLRRLMDAETALNDQRRLGDASYSVARHVDVLIAMMGEARLLRAAEDAAAARPRPQVKASGMESFLRAT